MPRIFVVNLRQKFRILSRIQNLMSRYFQDIKFPFLYYTADEDYAQL